MFSDEHDEQSYLGWFLLISIILHALFFWLWPQRQGALFTGVGLDQGGMVELVFVEGQPAIQPPTPPRPTPPVQERPPRQEQTPEPEPEPETVPAAAVRTEEERVEPLQPSAPPVMEERPTPEPQPAPEPAPEPTSEPEPTPQAPAESEPGVAEDVLLSERGEFEIPVTPEPEPEPQTAPEPPTDPELQPDVEAERQPEAPAEDAERAGESPAVEAGDEAVEGSPDGDPDGEGAEPAAPPPASLATRFGLGSPKAVEDVPLDEVLDEVRVEIYVRSDGTVERVGLLSSSGRELVDEALVGLMERWSFEATGSPYVEVWSVSFEPALHDGRTVWRPQPQFVERR